MIGRTDPIASTWVPKPGGGVRRMARLSPRDDVRWRAVVGRVAAAVERSLSPRVMANRVAGGGQGWSLEPVGPALHRARRAAAALPGRLLVRTDVAAFYPSVGPGTACRALRAAGSDRADALEAAALLEGWASHGYPGLPIGPPASAVVANAVLAPVDDILRGLPFLRWVDDYVVAVRSPREAGEILDRLDDALDRRGLARSERKTAIGDLLPSWAAARRSRSGDAARDDSAMGHNPSMARLAVAASLVALVGAGCGGNTEDQAGVYAAALRHVIDQDGERPLFVLGATCENAGGSQWADRCEEEIPDEVSQDVEQRLRGVAPVTFVEDLRMVRITIFGIVQQGGALVLFGPITFEGDTATMGINWTDEAPEVASHGEMLRLARTGGRWRVVSGSA